ncbi:hypothetical protein [Variovorax sp. J31P207]|uniref:hypothetical protein n=1 Tax=Variovorax sp. J31P207 TaxID=3053510 RepID=UPI002577C8B3|nr:hypothetical protein [Variovorax sp. J31P207]MDM0072236.1 hypothetical protein [Variovorax sp. J31P207]
MSLTSKTRTCTAGAALALLGAVALLPLSAQGAESKVLNGIERGSDAAGRGIERGAHATRQGVDHTAERASAPVRRWGEALGRKITPAGSHKPAAPAVGPQGTAP